MTSYDPYLSYARRGRRKHRRPRHILRTLSTYGIRFFNRPPSQSAFMMGVAMALVLAALTVPPVGTVIDIPAPPSSWTTFSGASQMVAPMIAGTAGGPWNVSLVEGVAASGPWSPTLSMWGLNGSWASTIASCQSLLAGPSVFTFWNNTEYPSASGPAVFESGGAGLWSFVYLNASGAALVLSVIGAHAQLNGVVPPHSACAQIGGPFRAPTSYLNTANVTSPSTFAVDSYSWLTAGGNAPATGTAAFYILGNPAVPVAFYAPGYNQEWSTYYGTCGAPGVNGQTTYSGAPQPIPQRPGYLEEVTVGNYCYQSMDALMPGPKEIWNITGTFYASWPLSVLVDSSTRPATQAVAPTTSLFQLGVLLNSTEGPFSFKFASGQPRCVPGDPTVSDCLSEPLSWYAALVGPTGAVLDTFPTFAGAHSWTDANVSITSDDHLVLVSSVPVFSLANSGLEFESGYDPYVCCGIGFGPSTVSMGGPFEL